MVGRSGVGRHIKCRRCRQPRWVLRPGVLCSYCLGVVFRQEEGLCTSVLWHGPGHQSRTFCEHRQGDHPVSRRRIVHEATYGSYDQRASWHGRKASSGYFDEPPCIEEYRQ